MKPVSVVSVLEECHGRLEAQRQFYGHLLRAYRRWLLVAVAIAGLEMGFLMARFVLLPLVGLY